jgi:hypothetical protein
MGHRYASRVVSLAAVAALAALAPPAAAQQPAAQGTITGSGTQYTLVIQNTGGVQLRCMRLFTRVDVTGATGPGQTQVEGPRVFSSQNFALNPGGSLEWTFTTAQPYPENGGGDLRISADCQQDAAAPVTGPAAQAPPGPQPVVGQTEVITVLRGTVLVRRRGARRFVRVTGTQAIPDRSEIDTRRGALRLTVANGSGGTETADVAEGRAIVDQDTAARPLTTLRLSEPLACPRVGAGPRATQSQRRRKRRRIYVKTVGGNVKTKGRYAEAIARGTAWRTNDQCNATVIQVLEGTVEVISRVGRATVTAPRRVIVARRPR